MYRCERYRQCHDRCIEHGKDCAEVTGKQELDGRFDVSVYISPVFDRFYNCGKVVVCQHHCRGIFGYFTACDTHGHTDISLFQCRGIINAVSGHRYDISFILPCAYNTDLVFRRHAGIDRDAFYKIFQFFIRHLIDLGTLARLGFIFKNTDTFCNCSGRYFMVTCNHDRTDTGFLTFRDSGFGLFTRRIHHSDQTDKCEVIFVIKSQLFLVRHNLISKCQYSETFS